MARRELIYDIERYCPFNEQEEKDKALILNWIKTNIKKLPYQQFIFIIMVDAKGLEPLTPSTSRKCSPN